MTQFFVKLDPFDGPLDLMLHLIRHKKLDLHDLNLDVLVEQYILFVESVENKLDLAADYLAELANLIEIKSFKALPVDPNELEGGDYQEDPHQALVRRLLEYQQFKEVSDVLNNRYRERQLQFDKPVDGALRSLAQQEDVHLYQADQHDLMKAMERCLNRFQMTHPREVRITKIEMSVEARMDHLIAWISTLNEPFVFEDFVQDAQNVGVFIITFLALLELVRTEFIVFTKAQGDIHFRKGPKYEFNA
jgi:segregation and condensation protein A